MQIKRHKTLLTAIRTMLKNKINAILMRNGIVHAFSDVFGKAGMQCLYSLDLELRNRIQIDNYLNAIEHLNKLIVSSAKQKYTTVARRISKTIFAMLKNNAYYIPHLEEKKAS